MNNGYKNFDVKGYANQANAKKKAQKVWDEIGGGFKYMVVVNDKGRFVPVAFNISNEKGWLMSDLLHNGLVVVN